jgi:hypothetical protein
MVDTAPQILEVVSFVSSHDETDTLATETHILNDRLAAASTAAPLQVVQ